MSTKRQVRRVGYFRELGHGARWPSMSPAQDAMPNKEKLVAYLRAGAMMTYSPGLVDDVLDDTHRAIGSAGSLTDGTYAWPEVLAYYVERYNIALPDEFLRHAAALGWRVPDGIDTASLE